MFHPQSVIFETSAMEYELGRKLYDQFNSMNSVELIQAPLNKVKSIIMEDTLAKTYQKGKKTLVICRKRPGAFQTCKPSADYMLPLVSGCMGQCEYCYLHTQLGDKPYIRVNVNIEEILEQAKEYMLKQPEKIISFEGAATSDPVCVEPYTHALERSIRFFAKEEARFRFVTKYSDVDTLLDLPHNNHTEIRFSINTPRVRNAYEHYTASIDARIQAASKVIEAGYPVGFLIAPVFLYDGWKEEYRTMLEGLRSSISCKWQHPIFFEIITHRFTPKAKEQIAELFPESTLPMKEEERTYRRGQFGYGKYLYPKECLQEVKQYFSTILPIVFPEGTIKYIV